MATRVPPLLPLAAFLVALLGAPSLAATAQAQKESRPARGEQRGEPETGGREDGKTGGREDGRRAETERPPVSEPKTRAAEPERRAEPRQAPPRSTGEPELRRRKP